MWNYMRDWTNAIVTQREKHIDFQFWIDVKINYWIHWRIDTERSVNQITEWIQKWISKQKSDAVFCICLDRILYVFRNSKFSFKIFYRNRNNQTTLQHAKTWKCKENTHSNRICVCLNVSEFFYVNFATSWRFYNNWTRSTIKQKFEKILKIHSQFKHTLISKFRNSFALKRFRNYKKIDQSKIQNCKQCENVEFEKFFTMYDDLSRIRKTSLRNQEDVMKLFIQIRFFFALTSQRSSFTNNFFRHSHELILKN